MLPRRRFLQSLAAGAIAGPLLAGERNPAPLKITGMRVTPIALPDPPLIFRSGARSCARASHEVR